MRSIVKSISAGNEGDNAQLHQGKRLEDLALQEGIIATSRRIASKTLPISTFMLKADKKDIVKRSSARRMRYLLVFNCQLAPAAAGRLGTFARLDSRNPVLYIEFPQGRLRLHGTMIFPRNKYIVLRTGTKEVICEDVLESMIVFSEAVWVGCLEGNPNEVPLPMPEDLKIACPHDPVNFNGRAAKAGNSAEGSVPPQKDGEVEVEENVARELERVSQPTSRRCSRRMNTKKRQRYAEDSDASFEDQSGQSGEEEDDGALVLRRNGTLTVCSKITRRLPAMVSDAELDNLEDGNVAKKEAGLCQFDRARKASRIAPKSAARIAVSGPSEKRASASKKSNNSMGTKAKLIESDDDEDNTGGEWDLTILDSEAKAQSNPRSQRTAAGRASRDILKASQPTTSGSEDGSENQTDSNGNIESPMSEDGSDFDVEEAAEDADSDDGYVPSD